MSHHILVLVSTFFASALMAQNIGELGPAPIAPANKLSVVRTAAIPAATWFDVSNRKAAQYLYTNFYGPFQDVPYGWNGSVPSCTPGTLSQDYKDAAAERFNFFRGMAGVPAGISFDPTIASSRQDAALMFSANTALSHTPPTSWTCYTSTGAAAAGQSNICISFGWPNDPGCVGRYVDDQGSNNTAAGHRRWILYPNTRTSATGDIPQNGSYYQANALAAWDSNVGGTSPATREAFVAWPPPGYFPYPLIPSSTRWSFGYPNADFSSATVSMQIGANSFSGVLETLANGYGMNTLVWQFNAVSFGAGADTPVTVHVNNVMISGSPQNFQYVVTVFDPASPSLTITPTSVFRSSTGGIYLTKAGSATVYPAGGVLASAPAAAQDGASNTFVAARDASNGVWVNVFTASSNTWGTWAFAGGVVQGDPGIASVPSGTAYIVARDPGKAYWLRSYDPSTGFGSWVPLGGVFETDPVIAAALDGSLYIAGRDGWNAIWSGRYIPGTGFQGWQLGGAVAQGKPSISAGMDGAMYVTIRDNWNAIWLGRVQGSSWTGWFPGGGVFGTDPQSIRVGNRTYVSGLDASGALWTRTFVEGTVNGWQTNWTNYGGVLQRIGVGATGRELYVFGSNASDAVYSFRPSTSAWTAVGANAGGGIAGAK